ncbi:MAG: TIGR02206 family membrane protein [Eubacteriales bacterium]|nr:TIGR02206 family membrane protein [Eubacteriales bacterium]
MRFFYHFFRGVEDGPPLTLFSPIHLGVLGLAVIIIFLIARYNDELRSNGRAKLGAKICAYTLLLSQIIKYVWDFSTGHFSVDQSLPFFPCRIAVWLLIVAVLFDVEAAWPLGCCWGALGGFIAPILADPYPFSWPHFTNIEFFLTHFFMLFLILFKIIADQPNFSKKTLRQLMSLTNLFLIVSWIVNLVLLRQGMHETNYAYLVSPPDFLSALRIQPPVYTILLAGVYNVVVVLCFGIFKLVCSRYYYHTYKLAELAYKDEFYE